MLPIQGRCISGNKIWTPTWAPTRSIETNPEQNPQGSLNQTEPEVPFLINEDGKKKKKRKRNLLALKPRKASSAHVEPLRQGWLPFGGEMTQYSLLAD